MLSFSMRNQESVVLNQDLQANQFPLCTSGFPLNKWM